MQVARALEGFVSRKVVKQTVMTVVYGVTRYGGRLQIEKRLRELSDFPQELVWEASHYLVRQVFHSLQEVFSGTRAIQHWLTESARLISHAGSAVEWVTPLGIPVVQPYHRDAKLLVKGGIQSVSCSVSADTSQKPNVLKQRNGFPPNFIHSLDSSHMMLTALHCYRKGLTFVSVHDCFWTHAADVPVMNEVCREQFVHLHSQPILQDLSRFLVQRYCPSPSPRSQKLSQRLHATRLRETLLAVPETGAFDLEQVKHSTYFFS
nr:DNA-directed RNA polymerase, mitochondrial [Oryctolagus cuniculus]